MAAGYMERRQRLIPSRHPLEEIPKVFQKSSDNRGYSEHRCSVNSPMQQAPENLEDTLQYAYHTYCVF